MPPGHAPDKSGPPRPERDGTKMPTPTCGKHKPLHKKGKNNKGRSRNQTPSAKKSPTYHFSIKKREKQQEQISRKGNIDAAPQHSAEPETGKKRIVGELEERGGPGTPSPDKKFRGFERGSKRTTEEVSLVLGMKTGETPIRRTKKNALGGDN